MHSRESNEGRVWARLWLDLGEKCLGRHRYWGMCSLNGLIEVLPGVMGVRNQKEGGHGHAWKVQGAGEGWFGEPHQGNLARCHWEPFLLPSPSLQVGRWLNDQARLYPMRGVIIPCPTLILLPNLRLHLPVLC